MPDASFISAAAAPIADALTAIGSLRSSIPSSSVLISYTSGGCIVRVASRRAPSRKAVEEEFRRAFAEAGWGGTARQTGGLAMEHPSRPTVSDVRNGTGRAAHAKRAREAPGCSRLGVRAPPEKGDSHWLQRR